MTYEHLDLETRKLVDNGQFTAVEHNEIDTLERNLPQQLGSKALEIVGPTQREVGRLIDLSQYDAIKADIEEVTMSMCDSCQRIIRSCTDTLLLSALRGDLDYEKVSEILVQKITERRGCVDC